MLADEIYLIIDFNSRNLGHTIPCKDVTAGQIHKRCRKSDVSNFLSVVKRTEFAFFFFFVFQICSFLV